MNCIKTVIRHMIRLLQRAETGIDRLSSRARTGKSPKDVLTIGVDPAAGDVGLTVARTDHATGIMQVIKPKVPPLDPEHVRRLIAKTYGLPPGILAGSPWAEAWHRSHPGGWPEDGADPNHWTSWAQPGVGMIGSDMGAEARAAAMAREEIDAQNAALGITWPCIHALGCGHRSVCGERGHCVEEPRFPGLESIRPEDITVRLFEEDEIMAVRPSNEIVCCRVCGHPDHTPIGYGCPGSVPSSDPSGGIESCRCDGERILP